MKAENKFMFTNDSVRKLKSTGKTHDMYYDAGCKGLGVRVTPVENLPAYVMITPKGGSTGGCRVKNIGNVYQVTLERAREIARNVMKNVEEYHNTPVKKNESLFIDFEKNGFYPRNPITVKPVEDTGSQKVILLENVALKQKIKEYQEENIDLKRRANGYYIQNMRYKNALDAIKNMLSRLDDNKEVTKDENN